MWQWLKRILGRQSPWERDCIKWRGRILDGERGHWCLNWDCLPVDETTPEWPCGCHFED